MDREKILRETARKCAAVLKDKYHVKRVYLIGSLVWGSVHEKSDIDLVVDGLEPEMYMKALTELWDMLPPDMELNLIPYEDAFQSLKEKTSESGELVYG